MNTEQSLPPRRRAILGSAVAAASLGLLARDRSGTTQERPATPAAADTPVFPAVTTPEGMPPFCLYAVLTFDEPRPRTAEWLQPLSETVSGLNRAGDDTAAAPIVPDMPASSLEGLAVGVGLGPSVAGLMTKRSYGTDVLPPFNGDASLPPERRSGDVLLLISTPELTVVDSVLTVLRSKLPPSKLSWQELGFRSRVEGTVARNPLGFKDGIIVPRSREDLFTNVITVEEDGSYSTICVIRQFELNVGAFGALGRDEREKIIGRTLDDGRPLSGGTTYDEVNLLAKDASGEYLVPKSSHARAAHPSFTGSELMVRRSYGYRQHPPSPDQRATEGLLFTSFQKNLRTFVETQRRMDEVDDLMKYAIARASFTFLMISPGGSA